LLQAGASARTRPPAPRYALCHAAGRARYRADERAVTAAKRGGTAEKPSVPQHDGWRVWKAFLLAVSCRPSAI